MRRILVPLDGSELAASILPDACRYACPHGELVLVQDVGGMPHRSDGKTDGRWAPHQGPDQYLNQQAESLRARGMRVEVAILEGSSTVQAIGEAAVQFQADMIACATHGRGPFGRLMWGSVAWRVLGQSTVSVLLRHPGKTPAEGDTLKEGARHILVPLDGSELAAQALPLAEELAQEWGAELWLAYVVSTLTTIDTPSAEGMQMRPYSQEDSVRQAQIYLDRVEKRMRCTAHSHVLDGMSAVNALLSIVDEGLITDIVMATHGRTGLARVLMGSVADELVHRLHCPIVMIPALAVQSAARGA